jgi:hypothetical protein
MKDGEEYAGYADADTGFDQQDTQLLAFDGVR